jgi:hypothetical protein
VNDSRLLEAEARQERIKVLLTRNLSLREIADAVGASLRTVSYDVKQIRQEAAATLSRSNVVELAATMLIRSEARHRELWALFARADAAPPQGLAAAAAITLKLNIIKELSRQTSGELQILVRLGIVVPAKKESMVGMKALTLLNSLPPSELELAVSQDTEHFVATLRRNLGDAGMTELFGEGWSLQAPSVCRARSTQASQSSFEASSRGNAQPVSPTSLL